VIINDTPFKTDLYLRIPYTLKTWEWMKEGVPKYNEYHFYTIIFVGWTLGTGERFAFDNMQVDDNFDKFYQGDPGKNSS
jgi:hypothetical protein